MKMSATTNGPDSAASAPVPDAGTAILPHSCRCGARWSGSRTAHCAAECHRTFAGVGGFDAHRRNGVCLDPARIGMELVAGRSYEVWGYPTDDDALTRLHALRDAR